MEKGPLPAKHTHGPIRKAPTQSSLHHKHGPTPGAQRSPNRTTAHQNPSGTFFLKNLKLIKNNDNALPKTKPLYSHIKLENYVHAA